MIEMPTPETQRFYERVFNLFTNEDYTVGMLAKRFDYSKYTIQNILRKERRRREQLERSRQNEV